MMGKKSFFHKSLNVALLVLAILYTIKTTNNNNNNNLNVEDIPLLLKQWKKKGIFGGEKDISILDFRTMITASSPTSFILKSIRLLFLLLENLDLLIRTVDCFASLLSYF